MTAKQNSDYLEKLNRLDQSLLRENVELTRQELKVLYWAIEGKTNEEIAEELDRHLCTIKTHKNNLIAKLNLKGRIEFQKYVLKMMKSHTLGGEKSI
ncbi:helix-turn-helix transcriptional regulator [Runella slithyformis]|uniref:Regulatory protein LuxR n=1 Tax=Runella slithyformis (strain ATCC 29530 / DSM 19594 / LMG 11500 / NCIMB 11436 / LSU 4) TaxID=761193 RepID=A0A7U4E449_RUNSL|nr:helix-turn-helix transcriptional regulator [Runella slithyformis]AEI47126.1 regulatory protein LuxR [Runella slithyformis DSM 19594]